MDPLFKNFLSDEQEQRILEAIRKAEKNTSGEIRVHLHKNARGDVMKNAIRTFEKLNMHKTALRNGILFYIDVDRKQFAVIGDKGIHEKVKADFWKSLAGILKAYFTKQQYASGLIEAINETGKRLKEFFPYQPDDKNELPDEISFE